MKQTVLTVQTNEPIAKNVMKITLSGDLSAIVRPGQFVNLKLDGFYLRRPISVCDAEGDLLTLIYKTVGDGTRAMAGYGKGKEIDCLVGLGNGYDEKDAGDRPLLVGGGVGVPPLYLLAKRLTAAGKRVAVILGFNTKDEVFFETEFRALGCDVRVTTVDGSCGTRGFVTDALHGLDPTCLYTCGPEPMLRALYRATVCPGQFSFERRMGCGFGACMGCTCKTISGNKRICREGPVLKREEILWEN